MRNKIVKTVLAGLILSARFSTVEADTFVDSYLRADGTYVQGHYRTEPNSTRNDNYSTRGNVNPYTGVEGTKPRDGEEATLISRYLAIGSVEVSNDSRRIPVAQDETYILSTPKIVNNEFVTIREASVYKSHKYQPIAVVVDTMINCGTKKFTSMAYSLYSGNDTAKFMDDHAAGDLDHRVIGETKWTDATSTPSNKIIIELACKK